MIAFDFLALPKKVQKQFFLNLNMSFRDFQLKLGSTWSLHPAFNVKLFQKQSCLLATLFNTMSKCCCHRNKIQKALGQSTLLKKHQQKELLSQPFLARKKELCGNGPQSSYFCALTSSKNKTERGGSNLINLHL